MSTPIYEFVNNPLIPAVVKHMGNQTPVWMQQRWEDGKYAVYVRQNGCGHCCVAMACNLLGVSLNPHQSIEKCVEIWGEPAIGLSGNQQYYFLTPTGMVEELNALGVKANWFGYENQGVESALNHILTSLKNGKMIAFISSPSDNFKDNPFSKGDHWVLAVGFTNEGKVLIANSSTNGIYDIGEGVQEVDGETIKRSFNPNGNPIKRTWGEIENLHLGIGYVVIG